MHMSSILKTLSHLIIIYLFFVLIFIIYLSEWKERILSETVRLMCIMCLCMQCILLWMFCHQRCRWSHVKTYAKCSRSALFRTSLYFTWNGVYGLCILNISIAWAVNNNDWLIKTVFIVTLNRCCSSSIVT